MRTTIDLPGSLIKAARVRAAQSDETLKELFTRALANELDRPARRARRQLPVVRSAQPGVATLTADDLAEALDDDRVDLR